MFNHALEINFEGYEIICLYQNLEMFNIFKKFRQIIF